MSIISVTQSGKASGTGIIMSADGYIITNHHVIENAQAVSVLTNDDKEYTASIVGSDETSDLAVLKIEASGLQAAEFGDSSVLQVGDSVVAIGDPLGVTLRGTMTDGIISAINRDLTVNDRTMNLIQTNAALNNGNSGGPLINCYGQVIGINTMKMSNFYSSSTTVEGIGFAIPIDTAKPIIDELIEKGYVSGRPAIGIDGETLPATYRIYYRLPEGIYVTRVYASSDAAAKGISEGDIITAINGIDVTTMEQLNRVKNQFTAGQTVTLTIYRSGSSYDVEIILMDRANA
ncbi:MAG: S1C family serine protease [Oscillospiraceae bacterium]